MKTYQSNWIAVYPEKVLRQMVPTVESILRVGLLSSGAKFSDWTLLPAFGKKVYWGEMFSFHCSPTLFTLGHKRVRDGNKSGISHESCFLRFPSNLEAEWNESSYQSIGSSFLLFIRHQLRAPAQVRKPARTLTLDIHSGLLSSAPSFPGSRPEQAEISARSWP